MHQQKSKILALSNGVDFIGFRNFYHFRLLRKRNIRNMRRKITYFKNGETTLPKLSESYQGWKAYTKWANTKILRRTLKREIVEAIIKKV